MQEKSNIPDYLEWVAHEYTQIALRDIYDTLVKGADKRPFWAYVSEVTQEKFERQKCAAFRHMLPCHERFGGDGHAIDKDSGKPHLANALARAFIARAQQVFLLNNLTGKEMKESNDE